MLMLALKGKLEQNHPLEQQEIVTARQSKPAPNIDLRDYNSMTIHENDVKIDIKQLKDSFYIPENSQFQTQMNNQTEYLPPEIIIEEDEAEKS